MDTKIHIFGDVFADSVNAYYNPSVLPGEWPLDTYQSVGFAWDPINSRFSLKTANTAGAPPAIMIDSKMGSTVAPTMPEDLVRKSELDAVASGVSWQPSVLAIADEPVPPPNPVIGDRYIAANTAGTWIKDHIYQCLTTAPDPITWQDLIPSEGWACLVLSGTVYPDQAVIYTDAVPGPQQWAPIGISIDHFDLIHRGNHKHTRTLPGDIITIDEHIDTVTGADPHSGQDLHTNAAPTFAGATLSRATPGPILTFNNTTGVKTAAISLTDAGIVNLSTSPGGSYVFATNISAGDMTIQSAVAASNKTTAALVVIGGISTSGQVYADRFTAETNGTSARHLTMIDTSAGPTSATIRNNASTIEFAIPLTTAGKGYTFAGDADAGIVTIQSTLDSNATTGALVVSGGARIAKNAAIGAELRLYDITAPFTDYSRIWRNGATTYLDSSTASQTLDISTNFSRIEINSVTNATDATNGAVHLDGGASIAQDLHVGGTVQIHGSNPTILDCTGGNFEITPGPIDSPPTINGSVTFKRTLSSGGDVIIQSNTDATIGPVTASLQTNGGIYVAKRVYAANVTCVNAPLVGTDIMRQTDFMGSSLNLTPQFLRVGIGASPDGTDPLTISTNGTTAQHINLVDTSAGPTEATIRNNASNIEFAIPLTVAGKGYTFAGDADAGIVTVQSTLDSNATTGALVVSGGASFGKQVTAKKIVATGQLQVTKTSTLGVDMETAVLIAAYNQTTNLNYAYNSALLQGTATSGCAIVGEKLDCTGGKRMTYTGTSILPAMNTGCLRFRFTPNWTGSPSNAQYPIKFTGTGSNDLLQVRFWHTGAIQLYLYDQAGTNLIASEFGGPFSAVSGTEYEFIILWEIGGLAKCYINGTQHGINKAVSAGTRGTTLTTFQVGTDASTNFYIRDVSLITSLTAVTPTDPAGEYTVLRTKSYGVISANAITTNGTALFAGIAQMANTTNSTSTSTGALQVAGGAAITKNLNVGASLRYASQDQRTNFNSGHVSKWIRVYTPYLPTTDDRNILYLWTNLYETNWSAAIYLQNTNTPTGSSRISITSNNKATDLACKVIVYLNNDTGKLHTYVSFNYTAHHFRFELGSGNMPTIEFTTAYGDDTGVPTDLTGSYTLKHSNTDVVGTNNINNIYCDAAGDVVINAIGNDVKMHSTDAVIVQNTTDSSSTTTGAFQCSAGGAAIAKSLHVGNGIRCASNLSSALFIASYANSIHADIGTSLLGTAAGGATITAGKLDCSGVAGKYVTYDVSSTLSAMTGQGFIRFKYTPNYSGIPSSTKYLLLINVYGAANCILLTHNASTGGLDLRMCDSAGVFIFTGASYNWTTAVAGTEYEICLSFDTTTASNTRWFLDGVLRGNPNTYSATGRSGTHTTMWVGGIPTIATSDCYIRDLVIGNTNLYTAAYTVATPAARGIDSYALADVDALNCSGRALIAHVEDAADLGQGSLVTLGGASIAKNLHVGGTVSIHGSNPVVLDNSSGQLVVTGVDGFGYTFAKPGATAGSGDVQILSTSASTGLTDGALRISGGLSAKGATHGQTSSSIWTTDVVPLEALKVGVTNTTGAIRFTPGVTGAGYTFGRATSGGSIVLESDVEAGTGPAAGSIITPGGISAAKNVYAAGLKVAATVPIVTHFDTDVALAANSDTRLATQKATKTYVDTSVGAITTITYVNGFADPSNTVISFTDGAIQFTIAPSGADYIFYSNSVKYTKSAPLSIVLGGTPPPTGIHYIYFDDAGALAETMTFTDDLILKYCFISVVYWNNTAGYAINVADYRHGYSMSPYTHRNLYYGEGTVYVSGITPSGFTVDGDGSSDSHAQFTVTDGRILFADISKDITGKAALTTTVKLFYLLGNPGIWYKAVAPNLTTGAYYFNTGDSRIKYNLNTAGTWSLADVPNGDYVLGHIACSSEGVLIVFLGQDSYGNANAARNAAATELASLYLVGIPLENYVFIATIIYRYRASYANTYKCTVISTSTGAPFIDWRDVRLNSTAGAPTSHSSLSNLLSDDHTQYFQVLGRPGEALTIQNNDGTPKGTTITTTLATGEMTFTRYTGVGYTFVGGAADGIITVQSSLDSGATTGALVVSGGARIAKNAAIGAEIRAYDIAAPFTAYSRLWRNGATTYLDSSTASQTLDISTNFSRVEINSMANATDTSTGALHLDGGASIAQDVWVGGTVNIVGSEPVSIDNASGQMVFEIKEPTAGYTFKRVAAASNGGAITLECDTEASVGLTAAGSIITPGGISAAKSMRAGYDCIAERSAIGGNNKSTATFIAALTHTVHADYGTATTGTLNGMAAITGEYLDLTTGGGSQVGYASWPASNIAAITNTGTIRFFYRPAYTGAPAGAAKQAIFTVHGAAYVNEIHIFHLGLTDPSHPSSIEIYMNDSAGLNGVTMWTGALAGTLINGTTYEFCLCFDNTVVNGTRFYINGSQKGGTMDTSAIVRNTAVTDFNLGYSSLIANNSQCSMRSLIVYPTALFTGLSYSIGDFTARGAQCYGATYLEGQTTSGTAYFTNAENSTGLGIGAAIFDGGISVAKDIHVGGTVQIHGSNPVIIDNDAGQLTFTPTVASKGYTFNRFSGAGSGDVQVASTTTGSGGTTGALSVAGGVTIEKNIITRDTIGMLDSSVAGAFFVAALERSINADCAQLPTGTAYGGAAIVNGRLDLTGGTRKYVYWSAVPYGSLVQHTATVRFLYTPNYFGYPTSLHILFGIFEMTTWNNEIYISHKPSTGTINIFIRDYQADTLCNVDLTAWSPIAGVEYEFCLCVDCDNANNTRLFINGTQWGATMSSPGTRSTSVNYIILGDEDITFAYPNTADGYFRALSLYPTVLYTTNYSAGAYSAFAGQIADTTRVKDLYASKQIVCVGAPSSITGVTRVQEAGSLSVGSASTNVRGNIFVASYATQVIPEMSAVSTTIVRGATISGGKLNLTGNTNKYIQHDAATNLAGTSGAFTFRCKFTPNYTASTAPFVPPPAMEWIFTAGSETSEYNNAIWFRHTDSGDSQFLVFDSAGGGPIVNASGARLDVTSGVEYEIELDCDPSSNGSTAYVFVNGAILQTATVTTGIGRTSAQTFCIGSTVYNPNATTAQFSVRDVMIFNSIQHTAAYVTGYSTSGLSDHSLALVPNAFISGTLHSKGTSLFDNPTDSSAVGNGAMVIGGGVSIAKAINTAGIIKTTNTTASSDVTSGCIVAGGGIGVAGDIHVGGTVSIHGGDASSIILYASGVNNPVVLDNNAGAFEATITTSSKGYIFKPKSSEASTSGSVTVECDAEATSKTAAAFMVAGGIGSSKRVWAKQMTCEDAPTTSTEVANKSYVDGVTFSQDVSGCVFLATFRKAVMTDYISVTGAITQTGTLAITDSKLALTGGAATKHVTYPGIDIRGPNTIRLRVTPAYTGSPATEQYFFNAETTGAANLISIYHLPSGKLAVEMTDSTGAAAIYGELSWSPTSGIEYEFELDYGAVSAPFDLRLFIDGGSSYVNLSHGSVTMIAQTNMRIGDTLPSGTPANSYANFSIRDVVIFPSVKHTAAYTAGYTTYHDVAPSVNLDGAYVKGDMAVVRNISCATLSTTGTATTSGAVSFSGTGLTTSVDMLFYRIGNIVQIQMNNGAGTGATDGAYSASASACVPVGFRPYQNIYIPVKMTINGAHSIGDFLVETNGNCTIHAIPGWSNGQTVVLNTSGGSYYCV